MPNNETDYVVVFQHLTSVNSLAHNGGNSFGRHINALQMYVLLQVQGINE